MQKLQNRRIADALTTADLWTLMLKRVPPVVTEYFRGGADQEITLHSNVRAFQQSLITARGATKFDDLDMTTNVVGHNIQVPWYISPVGSLRSLYPYADALAAKVAGEYGTIMAQSTFSGTNMEDVANATNGPCWFQLYLCGGRETAIRTLERAKQAGFSGLILTIDTGVSGLRAQHARMKPMLVSSSFRGLSYKKKIDLAIRKLKVVPQMLPRLGWLWDHLNDGGLMQFVNILDEHGQPLPYADIETQLASSAVTWEDINWIREVWGENSPIIVKGVHCAEDVRKAEELGVNGIVWSNHGGRQQDRVPPSLHMLATEMPRVGETALDVMMDGGVRNGTDILIALSYGIKAVGIGRVAVAGIGAGGYAGLNRAFEILVKDLDRAMRLIGVSSIDEVRRHGAEIRRESRLIGDEHLAPVVF